MTELGSDEPVPPDQSLPLALILVRNDLRHDARVLREASALQGLGFSVLVAGVRANTGPRAQPMENARTVLLDPGRPFRTVRRRWRAGRSVKAQVPAGAGASPAARSPRGTSRAGARGPAGAPRPAVGRRARRLMLTLAYYIQGVRLVADYRPVLVHANDYNTMWIGVVAKLLCRSRLIYDCHELWPDRNGRPEWRRWLLACEAMFVRVADAVITTSPGYAELMARRYRISQPVVVRNVPQTVPVNAPQTSPVEVTRPDPGGAVGVYVGGLMPGRGLEQALRALAHAPGIRLRMIGPGHEAYRQSLVQLAGQTGSADRVEILPAVAPDRVVEAIAGADFGLMLIQPVCRSYELTLPNKLFEYAAAGLPILASDLPVIGQVVRQGELGRVVAPDDPEHIARGMSELSQAALNRELRAHVAQFGRQNTWDTERGVLESVYSAQSGAEAARLKSTYLSYGSDPAKRASWQSQHPGNAAIRHELVQTVFAIAGDALRGSRRILDAGCGTGWWLAELSRSEGVQAELHGLDLIGDRVLAARGRVPGAMIEPGDVRALPFEDGAFDVVTLFTVLSSLSGTADVRRALQEARRVLAPGGTLLIWEPRIPNPRNRHTILVSARLLEQALDGMTTETAAITLLPPLARRLGGRTAALYPALTRLALLRSHRLVRAQAPPAESWPSSS